MQDKINNLKNDAGKNVQIINYVTEVYIVNAYINDLTVFYICFIWSARKCLIENIDHDELTPYRKF